MEELDVAHLAGVLGAFTRMNIRLPRVGQMSFTTLSVLHTLATTGPKRLSALVASEQVTQPAMTQLVNKLERDALVTRQPDPADGRAVLVQITPLGAEIVSRRRVERRARLQEFADRLDPDDQKAIARAIPALERLVAIAEGQSP